MTNEASIKMTGFIIAIGLLVMLSLFAADVNADQGICSAKGCSASASVTFSITIPLCIWTMPDGSTIDNSTQVVDKSAIANAVSVRCTNTTALQNPTVNQSLLASP